MKAHCICWKGYLARWPSPRGHRASRVDERECVIVAQTQRQCSMSGPAAVPSHTQGGCQPELSGPLLSVQLQNSAVFVHCNMLSWTFAWFTCDWLMSGCWQSYNSVSHRKEKRRKNRIYVNLDALDDVQSMSDTVLTYSKGSQLFLSPFLKGTQNFPQCRKSKVTNKQRSKHSGQTQGHNGEAKQKPKNWQAVQSHGAKTDGLTGKRGDIHMSTVTVQPILSRMNAVHASTKE